jgi:hypothetical protein
MDYGDILRRAWQITWKNKGLWILGILAGCSGNNGNASQSVSYQTSSQEFPYLERTFDSLPPETLALIVGAVILVAVIAGLAFLVLGILGQAGLIAGVAHADESGSVRLAEAWRLGLPHFWRLLGMAALLVAVILVIAVAAAIFSVITLGVGALCLLPLLCLILPLAVVLAAYLPMVQNGIVLERLGVFEAFRRAWQLLKSNPGPLVLMAVIVLAIALVVGIVVAAPFLIVALPLIAVAASQGTGAGLNAWLPLLACGAVYLPVAIVLNGVMTTFTSGVWTLTFRRLTGAGSPEVAVPAPG